MKIIKFCVYCEREVLVGSKYCSSCNSKLPIETSKYLRRLALILLIAAAAAWAAFRGF